MIFVGNFLTVFVLVCMFIFQSVDGVPVGAHELVFNPTITAPQEYASWARGSIQTVTWETKNIPSRYLYSTGLVLLGYMENNSENLDIDHPLASSFSITDGSVDVTMPGDLPPRDDYFIVLFGNSGNRSPKFKIA